MVEGALLPLIDLKQDLLNKCDDGGEGEEPPCKVIQTFYYSSNLLITDDTVPQNAL